MPRIKSARKALRQNLRKQKRNQFRRSALKNAIKGYQKLLKAKNIEEAKKQLAQVYKQLDKLAKINFIKAGKAKRLKSRLAKKLRP